MPENKVKETKTKVEAKVGEMVKENGHNGFTRSAVRKTFLAGVGAMATAQEEIGDIVNRLVEKGEQAEREGRKMFKQTIERRRKETARLEKQLDERVETVVEKVMARMNVPTKSDIDRLSAKIAELSHKVEDLKKN